MADTFRDKDGNLIIPDDEEQGVVAEVEFPFGMAVIDGYYLMSIKKVWQNMQFRQGTSDTGYGYTFEPTFGNMVLVAIPTREDPPELLEVLVKELHGFVMTYDEFLYSGKLLMKAQIEIEQAKLDAKEQVKEKGL